MAKAVLTDGCGSAWVEAGCDEAEGELSERLPGRFLTDRFSPGYGDLPLSLQPTLCGALDTQRTLGLYVTDSCLLNPGKSVTAIVGVADRPQMARCAGVPLLLHEPDLSTAQRRKELWALLILPIT